MKLHVYCFPFTNTLGFSEIGTSRCALRQQGGQQGGTAVSSFVVDRLLLQRIWSRVSVRQNGIN